MSINLEKDFPQSGVFDAVERRLKKEELVNVSFKILAFSKAIKGTDGDFHFLLCQDKEGPFTTSANDIMMQRLRKLVFAVGLDEEKSTEEESYLPDVVEVKLVKEKSTTTGREYFKFA